ncbi:MAG: DUF4830 domain-containing protein [Oscillospiraceae bacterium]|jgi:hypothetical protein|nr:DUF4830 domain-containing protein [Oscillospiraceae bacterium]
MVVISARFSKKRAAIAVVALGAALAAIVFLAARCGKSGGGTNAATNAERVAYLSSYGWKVDEVCLEEQSVVIPKEFGAVYETYNELQRKQGFDLSEYAGRDVTRYTYEILNYANADVTVVADIIVCGGKVIAGDVQSNSLDGFMTTLSGGRES